MNVTRFFRDALRGPLGTRYRKAQEDLCPYGADAARRGGVIAPMFNDFIDATGPKVDGWVADGNNERMGGYALSKCWVQP